MRGLRWILVGLLGGVAGIAALAQPTSLEVRKLELAIKESRLELATRIAALENQRTVLFGVLGVTVLAVPLAGLRLFRRAEKMAQERLEKIIESRPKALMQLIAERDAERRLRGETRVLIVSENTELETVLRQHGFSSVVTKGREALADSLEEAVVVFDMVSGVSQEEAAGAITTHNLDHVLAFSYGRLDLPQGKATYANSHMTLFSRLIELLKFKDAAARG